MHQVLEIPLSVAKNWSEPICEETKEAEGKAVGKNLEGQYRELT